MTTEEHLKKIKTKCESLLAIAEKRTPGKWMQKSKDTSSVIKLHSDREEYVSVCYPENSTFIASCAGPAEAGWRATIAAVNDLLGYRELHKNTRMEVDLLAAWPEELL